MRLLAILGLVAIAAIVGWQVRTADTVTVLVVALALGVSGLLWRHT